MSQKYADIIIDISHEAIDRPFLYKIPEKLMDIIDIGSLVLVPFGNGNKRRKGYVIGFRDEANYDVSKVKEIDSIAEKGIAIEGILIKLADWMRRQYGSTMIHALETVMPVKEKVRKVAARVELEGLTMHNPPVLALNSEQQALVDEFVENNLKHRTYLLHGITGSGKTEVYIECIKKCIERGKQAIVLIPEISLASQTVARFKQHFGDRVAMIHSELNKGEKYRAIMSIKNHEADVIIGPRSALFAPCDNLGLIVIDEEHDGAYKSEQSPTYHAREVAIERARLENIPIILGSATPSMESYTMALEGRFRLWKLNERPDGRSLPEVKVVDMRQEMRLGNKSIVSKELYDLINDRLEKKEQIMLFLNRRGFNSCLSCRSCGEAIMCPRCDTSLSLHIRRSFSDEASGKEARKGKLICHYCGYEREEPKVCPSCGSPFLAGFGVGTQKIETELLKLFPKARVLRLDRDVTTHKGSRERLLNAFKNQEADILLGTQMIVKGHDFPNVTLVGTIIADVSLFDNDFRAGERTFQLLTQASGRAGRGDKPGCAIIQTYKPEHYAIEAAKNQDFYEFYDTEISFRRLMKYPPASNMVAILITSLDKELAEKSSIEVQAIIKSLIPDTKKVRLIGQNEALLAKKNDRYRRVIYLKSEEMSALNEIMNAVNDIKIDNVTINIDVNPMENY